MEREKVTEAASELATNNFIVEKLCSYVKRLVEFDGSSELLTDSQGVEIHYLAASASLKYGVKIGEIRFVVNDNVGEEEFVITNDGILATVKLDQRFYERIKYGDMSIGDKDRLLRMLADIDAEYRKI